MGLESLGTAGISRSEILERQARTRDLAGREKLDAVMVVGRSAYDRPGHLAYLTNHFPPFPSTPFTETDRGMGYGIFLLPVEGEATLLIDRQSQAALSKEIVAVGDIRVAPDMITALIDLLKERKVEGGRVGIIGEDLLPATIYRHVVEALPELYLQPADDLVNVQRMIKSEAEIKLMGRAAEIAGAGHAAAIKAVKPGARENEICAEGTAAALRAGADFVRYFRVSTDPQLATTMRWPQATAREIQAGELVMMDIIGAYRGYQFDVFRCTVAGEADEEKRRLMDSVLRATEAAVAAAQAGTIAEELVKVARNVFEEVNYAQYSRSFMGHGIGLETVEPPLISPGDHTVLQPGMVLCIEPGLRIPGVGGCCIEQEVVVREEGPELLTPFAAQLW
ncbi:Xaa-Pro peptidase family protein [Acidobacteria bacterium AH-259-D05]|nr:Xaa-Pro peptidase family protein [Acidobacteria bacterium AH-259-D05]